MLLRQLLYRCDTRFLTIISRYWLSLQSQPNYEEVIRLLCEKMQDNSVLKKKLNSSEGQEFFTPLHDLLSQNGMERADTFEEQFGLLRYEGIEKILREKMWETPVSITEKLWFRGLIFREPRILDNELKDCYILPDDLRKNLAEILSETARPVSREKIFAVRPAIPSETAFPDSIDNSAPDIFSLALALERDKRPMMFPELNASEAYIRFHYMLISEGSFYPGNGSADTESIRTFLTGNRTAARLYLIKTWRRSENYDELNETSQITVTTAPEFDKTKPREAILNLLSALTTDTWISVNGFTAAVKKAFPNFLRGSFTENRGQMQDLNGNDLSGFGSWFQLEGEYIRFLLNGPLNWLGLIQSAYSDRNKTEMTGFRINRETIFYLAESSLTDISKEILSKPNLEQGLPVISNDGVITCTIKVPRYFRYMTTRYSEIEKVKENSVIFRITPTSLLNAENAGLSRSAFLSLLRRFSKNKIPPSLEKLLSLTDKSSVPAVIYTATILTVPNKEILTELLSVPRLEKWIIQQINPTSILIDKKGINDLRRFLMEKEIFVDVQQNSLQS